MIIASFLTINQRAVEDGPGHGTPLKCEVNPYRESLPFHLYRTGWGACIDMIMPS